MPSYPQPSAGPFAITPIQQIHLPQQIVDHRIQSIRNVTPDTEGRSDSPFNDIVDQLIHRLQTAEQHGWTWQEATAVKRRTWATLKMYTLHLGSQGAENWLHPFTEDIANSILSQPPESWHPSKRRQVTQLFLLQFNRIACLSHLSELLRRSWAVARGGTDEAAKVWAENANLIFHERGPEQLAQQLRQNETVEELAARFHISENGRFRELLYEWILIGRLKSIPLGVVQDDLFSRVERDKEHILSSGRALGSVAVEILIKRSASEGSGILPEAWSRKLVPLSCDPRTPSAANQARWWGWATIAEKQIAIRALAGLNLREFIALLEESLRGSGNAHQFPRRRDFLLQLYENKSILDARIVVHEDTYFKLDPHTRNMLLPSQVQSSQRASFICLKCTHDICLVEGTHNFALRGDIGNPNFPLPGFWESAPRHYRDSQFRIAERRCRIFQRHSGHWEDSFLYNLRSRHHIDWQL